MNWRYDLPKCAPEKGNNNMSKDARDALADALETADWSNVSIGNKAILIQAIATLRSVPDGAAGEPVAWRYRWADDLEDDWDLAPNEYSLPTDRRGWEIEPLYALPPATPPSDERAKVVEAAHYLKAIRERLESLYEISEEDSRLRKCLSDEVDWIDAELARLAALSPTNAPAAEGGR